MPIGMLYIGALAGWLGTPMALLVKRATAAGLSGLHNIRIVHRLEAIPLLGTGKTNYRALKELLADPD